MQHIDEHTLELYVLGSDTVAGLRGEIDAHLQECRGCRSTVETIRLFYEDAERALREETPGGSGADKALVRARQSLQVLYDDVGLPEPPLRAVTPLGRIQIFLRRRPVLAATAGTASVVALVAAILALVPQQRSEPHIARVFPNTQTSTLDIYGRDGSRLAAVPSRVINTGTQDFQYLTRCMLVVDIGRDGTPDVITTLPLWEESESVFLRVLNSRGEVVRRVPFEREIPTMIKDYPTRTFNPGDMVAVEDAKGQIGIFVAAASIYSPSVIVRFDDTLKEVGTYWHHGQFRIAGMDVDGDGLREILVYGIHDSSETTNREPAFVALLDPHRLIGSGQSSATPYYRVPPSRAERAYMIMPSSDMALARGSGAGARAFFRESDSVFSVAVNQGESSQPADVRYWIGRNLEVLAVRSSNPVDQLHGELRRTGRIRSVIGPRYWEDIRRAVRYWDGTTWTSSPTHVDHEGSARAGATEE